MSSVNSTESVSGCTSRTYFTGLVLVFVIWVVVSACIAAGSLAAVGGVQLNLGNMPVKADVSFFSVFFSMGLPIGLFLFGAYHMLCVVAYLLIGRSRSESLQQTQATETEKPKGMMRLTDDGELEEIDDL